MKNFMLLLLFVSYLSCQKAPFADSITLFEESNGMQSAPYAEGITWWKDLCKQSIQLQMQEFGMTDAGLPLHTITISKDGKKLENLAKSDKTIILINNAIHPGEPDGVDASMMLFRDLADQNLRNTSNRNLMDSCILVCIPYYNIGGALNRNSTSRANQDGPEEYGFRGNAQNLDLNRDFIKCDSRNAESFAKLLQFIDPDIYIETHVSNGADYQYTLTYLSTQPDKLGGDMGKQLRTKMIPGITSKMKAKDNEIVPYVNHWGGPLKDSYATFYDSPRYSSGLTTLHNIYGFITETHMLKPFKQRVEATYDYLLSSIEYAYEQSSEIQHTREVQKNDVASATSLPIDWEIDRYDITQFLFKGYEYGYKKSEVTGSDRLYYDTNKPVTKSMFYAGSMIETKRAVKPKAYILRRGYTEVENRLRWNGVRLQELKNDTAIHVISYTIDSFETVNQPYEKHYLHSNTRIFSDTSLWTFHKGDYLISMGTEKDRFILEVLEPEGPDSYFNWNFFDAVLQQKEHYSPYVFDDKAAKILNENPSLRAALEQKNKSEEDFNNNPASQLEWVYKQSMHYEKEHRRVPIFKTI